jgi:enterochelin esterase-like enzyme
VYAVQGRCTRWGKSLLRGGTNALRLSAFVLISFSIGACAASTPSPTSSPTATASPLPTMTPEATVVLTDTPSPSLIPVCDDASGRIIEATYPGAVIDREIPLIIYLPPCYATDATRYPVLYVLHGYPMDETHWDQLGVDEVVEEGILHDLWKPFLVVMPNIPDPLNVNSDGGPDSYEEEMLSGLIPYIDREYQTMAVPQMRAIAGVSRGAVWALEIGFHNPDQFNIVAALSPALHVNRPRPAYDPFNLVKTMEYLPRHIFLSAAEDEGGFRSGTEELSQLMNSLGISHDYLLTTGVHEDATWMGVMEDLIRFISTSWEDQSD